MNSPGETRDESAPGDFFVASGHFDVEFAKQFGGVV